MKARRVDDSALITSVVMAQVPEPATGFCFVQATDHTDGSAPDNGGRKGVKVVLSGEVVDLDSGLRLGGFTDRGRTANDGYYRFPLDETLGALPDTTNIGIVAEANLAGGRTVSGAEIGCFVGPGEDCVDSSSSLCLDDRFRVEVNWRTATGSGPGQVIRVSDREGIFFFESNDLVLKLLDECRANDHFWVFASAATSVEYDVAVSDTLTGAVRRYFNPLGRPAPAITDTTAFATCP